MIIALDSLLLLVFNFSCSVNETEAPHETVSACDDEEDDITVPTDDRSESKESREANIDHRMQVTEKIAISSEIPREKGKTSNDIKSSRNDQSLVYNIDESAIVSPEGNTKSQKVDSFIYSQSLKSSAPERPPHYEIGNFDKPVLKFTGLGSASISGKSEDVPSQPFPNVKESTKRLGSTGLMAASELSSEKAMSFKKIDPVPSVFTSNSLQSSNTENYGPSFGTANAFTGFAGKPFQPKDVPSTLTQSGRQATGGAGKIESLPVIRSSQISLQDKFSSGKISNEKHDGSERYYSNSPLAKPVSSGRILFIQFVNVKIFESNIGMAWFKIGHSLACSYSSNPSSLEKNLCKENTDCLHFY